MAPINMTREELLNIIKTNVDASVGTRLEEAMKKADENRSKWIQDVVNGIQAQKPLDTKSPGGIGVARMVKALAFGKMDLDKAAKYARESWKGQVGEEIAKALSASSGSAGGVLVPTYHSSEVIELLRPRVVVRRLGAVEWPMPNGNAEVPRITSGSTGYYVGENRNLTKSQPAFGLIKMNAKKLAALVPISNDLLRYNSPSSDAIVRNDMIASIQTREDLAFIRDLGTEYTPKGMRYWAAAGNILTMTATPDVPKVTIDLGRLVLALEEANVPFITPAWIMAPRTRHYLMTARDGNNNLVWQPEMSKGTLMGYPFAVTTQIPKNLGGGTNESELYFADMNDVVVGQADNIRLDVSTEASYIDENSQLVSAFSLDQTVMRVIEEHDLCVRHAESIAVLTGVTWGV